jgi:hypothetical protein
LPLSSFLRRLEALSAPDYLLISLPPPTCGTFPHEAICTYRFPLITFPRRFVALTAHGSLFFPLYTRRQRSYAYIHASSGLYIRYDTIRRYVFLLLAPRRQCLPHPLISHEISGHGTNVVVAFGFLGVWAFALYPPRLNTQSSWI